MNCSSCGCENMYVDIKDEKYIVHFCRNCGMFKSTYRCYMTHSICGNCDASEIIISKDGYLRHHICEVCGCPTMTLISNKEPVLF